MSREDLKNNDIIEISQRGWTEHCIIVGETKCYWKVRKLYQRSLGNRDERVLKSRFGSVIKRDHNYTMEDIESIYERVKSPAKHPTYDEFKDIARINFGVVPPTVKMIGGGWFKYNELTFRQDSLDLI